REVFVEVVAPVTLVIVGAGEIAVYLVGLARTLDFRTVVIDARAAFLTEDRFPEADLLLLGWADELADAAGIDEWSVVVAIAHDARADDPALAVALRRGARYVGALGSRRTHAARIERLRARGLREAELARIHAPIGLDLGGRTPADIALGILAEIVAELNREVGVAAVGVPRLADGEGRDDERPEPA
ncbi:MAG TPA: XdhC family protein, partial [Candidatus Binatia bacterium]|nr:XdhC family protein [Candidatus Binatia bacterium]